MLEDNNMIEILIGTALGVIALWIGSMEWRLRNTNQRLIDSVGRDELHRTIDIKMEAILILHREVKDDIREVKDQHNRISDKLDRLIQSR